MWSSASGAKPRHSLLLAMTPATKVPWPKPSSSVFSLVQLVLSLILLKWGWLLLRPVSNIATLTNERTVLEQFNQSELSICYLTPAPVTPISQSTSAWSILVIWRGTVLNNLNNQSEIRTVCINQSELSNTTCDPWPQLARMLIQETDFFFH